MRLWSRDQLPDRVLEQIVQYLRSWDYNQDDLRELSRTSRQLRQHSIGRVWEYFTITDIVISGRFASFAYIQPHLSRLLIADDEDITDAQWTRALCELNRMDWSHIKMFSVEFTGLHRTSDRCMQMILDFLHDGLSGVREQWVGLTEDREVMQRFFAKKYEKIEELRIIGKPIGEEGEYNAASQTRAGGLGNPEKLLLLPEYSLLTVVYLDGPAAEVTTAVDLVRQSHLTLRDLNIGELTTRLSNLLGVRSNGHSLEYPNLQRLAISNSLSDAVDPPEGLIDGTRFPGLQSLYFSETTYPSYGGHNIISESTQVRLMHRRWANVQCLAVDGMSQGDVARLADSMPKLEVLSIGALGSDAQLGDTEVPSVPVDLPTTGLILKSCCSLVDFRVETPELYEDMYNNHAEHQKVASGMANLPSFDRPFDPRTRYILDEPRTNLRHLTLNSWALTFDQIVELLDKLPMLNSFEGILKFTSRFLLTAQMQQRHGHLSHLSLAHDTLTKYKHVFKSNFLRFVAGFAVLKTLDVYGGLEVPGIENAVRHVVPGCSVGFYPLIPTWLLNAMDAEEQEDEEGLVE
ncbi:hypothetical protein GQ54DRAFT_304279 [Martensiomyces pterosporus]|nr:hypothetical protein GQ54DRAFT_304279 [Martensiomyces pterosporus]